MFSFTLFVATTLQAASAPKNIALMPAKGQGVDSVYALALDEKIKGELTATGAYRVLERVRMDEILKEQGLQQSGACDASGCLVQAGRLLGVDQMVGGTLAKVGNTFVASLSLVDVESGQIIASVDASVPASSDSLLQRAPRELVYKLRLASDTTFAHLQTQAAQVAASELRASQNRTHKVMAWSLAGGALVFAGVAAFFHNDAQKKFDRSDVYYAQYKAANTTSGAVAARASAQDQLDKGNRSQLVRNFAAATSLLCLGFSIKFFL